MGTEKTGECLFFGRLILLCFLYFPSFIVCLLRLLCFYVLFVSTYPVRLSTKEALE